MFIKDNILIVIFAFAVAMPGYFFAQVSDTGQTINNALRFGIIIAILGGIVFRMLLNGKFNIPRHILYLLAFLVPGLVVSVFKNPPVAYVPAAIRWGLYAVTAVLFFNMKKPAELLQRFLCWTFLIYCLSAILDVLAGRSMDINSAIRVVGSVGSAPGLASAIYVSALGCLAFNYRNLKIVLAVVSLAIVSILLTKTRFILVAFGFVAFLFLFVSVEKRNKMKILFPTLLIMAIGAFYILTSSDISQRFIFNTDDIQSDSSSVFRLLIIETVMNEYKVQDLFLGLGLGGFPLWFYKMTGIEGVAPHFEILSIITETGIVGLLLYILGMFSFLLKTYRRAWDKDIKPLFLLTLILVLSLQASLQFANPTYFYQVMLPIFMTIGTLLNQIHLGCSSASLHDSDCTA